MVRNFNHNLLGVMEGLHFFAIVDENVADCCVLHPVCTPSKTARKMES